jgi:hypothetical protein
MVLGHPSMCKDFTFKMVSPEDITSIIMALDTLNNWGVTLDGLTLQFPLQTPFCSMSRPRRMQPLPIADTKAFAKSVGRSLSSLTLLHVSTMDLAAIPQGSFPLLESLVLCSVFQTSQRHVRVFESSPKLVKVVMMPYQRVVRLPKRGLTHLALWWAPLCCLNGLDLSCLEVLHLDILERKATPKPFQLPKVPNLEYLFLQLHPVPHQYIEEVLTLVVPTLIYFGWDGSSDVTRTPLPPNPLRPLYLALERCPGLQMFIFTQKKAPSEDRRAGMTEIFKRLPNVRNLHLGEDEWDLPILNELCVATHVPKLAHLSVKTYKPYGHFDHQPTTLQEGTQALAKLIRSRGVDQGGSLESFTFVEFESAWPNIVCNWNTKVSFRNCYTAWCERALFMDILCAEIGMSEWPELVNIQPVVRQSHRLSY